DLNVEDGADVSDPVTYEQLDTAGDVGTSAGQLSIGNHTHTLVEDVVGSQAAAAVSYGTIGGRNRQQAVAAGGNWNGATETQTFAAGSLAVGVSFGSTRVATGGGSVFKQRLIMGGVQIAESAYISGTIAQMFVLVGTRALSGSQDCIVQFHNYGGSSYNLWLFASDTPTTQNDPLGVAVGSIKI
ncbi:hypothetical protein LCGC14_3164350, partial [marine sediment metagenome]